MAERNHSFFTTSSGGEFWVALTGKEVEDASEGQATLMLGKIITSQLLFAGPYNGNNKE